MSECFIHMTLNMLISNQLYASLRTIVPFVQDFFKSTFKLDNDQAFRGRKFELVRFKTK